MAEKLKFFSVNKLVFSDDRFRLKLKGGLYLDWINYGQVVKINGTDLSTILTNDLVTSEEDILIENIFANIIKGNFFFDTFQFCYGEDELKFSLKIGESVLEFLFRIKWDSRDTELLDDKTELDLMLTLMRNHAGRDFEYVQNLIFKWSRPELISNGPIQLVVLRDGIPAIMGIPEEENRITYIDAFFRTLFKFRKDYELR